MMQIYTKILKHGRKIDSYSMLFDSTCLEVNIFPSTYFI